MGQDPEGQDVLLPMYPDGLGCEQELRALGRAHVRVSEASTCLNPRGERSRSMDGVQASLTFPSLRSHLSHWAPRPEGPPTPA